MVAEVAEERARRRKIIRWTDPASPWMQSPVAIEADQGGPGRRWGLRPVPSRVSREEADERRHEPDAA